MFPFHKRKVKTISMKPPIFGECYMKHQLKLKDIPNRPFDIFKFSLKNRPQQEALVNNYRVCGVYSQSLVLRWYVVLG